MTLPHPGSAPAAGPAPVRPIVGAVRPSSTAIATVTAVVAALVMAAVLASCGDASAPVVGSGGSVPSVAPTVPDTMPSPPTTGPPTTEPPEPTEPTVPPTPPTNETLRYDPGRLRDELAAARAQWDTSGITSYHLTQTPVCFCPPEVVTADVFAGRVVDRGGPYEARSVDEWFDVIDAEIGTAVAMSVRYDPELGHPMSVYVDVSELIADEEYGVEGVELVPIDDPITALTTDPYPCGHGFWAASPEQTVAVMIGVPIGDDVDGEPVPGAYDFTTLVGEIRFGTDLMANWCDDAIEEGEPEAAVTETWRIVGGSLEYTVVDGAGTTTANAVLTDIVAVDGDGAEHRLGDATIPNDAWGLFAG